MHTKIRSAAAVLFLVVCCAVGTSVVWAQQSPNPVITLSETAMSKYIVKRGFVPYRKGVLATDINVQFANGLYFDVWGQTPMNGSNNFARELDITAGYHNSIVDFGVSYFDLIPLEKLSGDLVDVYGEVHQSFSLWGCPKMDCPNRVHAFTAYAKFEGMLATTDTNRNSGYLASVGMRHLWWINPQINIADSMNFVYDGGIFGGSTGLVGRYDMALNVKFSKAVTISPIVLRLSTPITHMHDRKFAQAFGAGVTVVLP